MQSPDWDSTAIFLSWDDWGGFYDHVVPPVVDRARLRPPRARDRDQPVRQAGLTSITRPSATTPTTSSSRTTSSAAQRLDPATDGRPDPRPDVRENNPILGDLAVDFDFTQPPRPPLILPVHPTPGPASTPP